MKTTPTGIPIFPCKNCGREHPSNRDHCLQCGQASAFLDPDGICLPCGRKP